MTLNDKTHDFKKAMDAAVRILVYRNHTKSELERKLSKKGFNDDIIRQVITDCENMNYLDDERITHDYFSELVRKGYGPRHMRMAMRRKGIDSDLIERVINEGFSEDDEFNNAFSVLKKKKSFEREADIKKRKEKIFRFLYSRGYSKYIILKILAEYEY